MRETGTWHRGEQGLFCYSTDWRTWHTLVRLRVSSERRIERVEVKVSTRRPRKDWTRPVLTHCLPKQAAVYRTLTTTALPGSVLRVERSAVLQRCRWYVCDRVDFVAWAAIVNRHTIGIRTTTQGPVFGPGPMEATGTHQGQALVPARDWLTAKLQVAQSQEPPAESQHYVCRYVVRRAGLDSTGGLLLGHPACIRRKRIGKDYVHEYPL